MRILLKRPKRGIGKNTLALQAKLQSTFQKTVDPE
jgi:hypothetical protein